MAQSALLGLKQRFAEQVYSTRKMGISLGEPTGEGKASKQLDVCRLVVSWAGLRVSLESNCVRPKEANFIAQVQCFMTLADLGVSMSQD